MPEYLLLKRGLYYRPNNMGYTGIREEAGRHEASDAMLDAGVTAIHEKDAPEFSKACWDDIKVAHLIKQRDRLLVALTPSEEMESAYSRVISDDWRPRHSTTISWTAIKAIMALIRKQAGVE